MKRLTVFRMERTGAAMVETVPGSRWESRTILLSRRMRWDNSERPRNAKEKHTPSRGCIIIIIIIIIVE
jgi:hypothetical protein